MCSLLDRLADAAPTEEGTTGTYLYLDDERHLHYSLGFVDLLVWLGALRHDHSTLAVRATSAQAGYLFRLLSDLLASDANLISDWTHEGLTPLQEQRHPFGAAVDFLFALEQRRFEILPGAAPVREVCAAVGLLTRCERSDERAYLLVYDTPSALWQLPGGRFAKKDGTLHKTMLRELSEELGLGLLVEPDDLTLTEVSTPLLKTWLSPTYGVLSRTLFKTFAIELKRELPLHNGLCWVSEREVLSGITDKGQSISAPALFQLLTQEPARLGALPAA
jgi:8-oxo-dGTP pyrophosphatase MutT (NUDIX family)